MMRTMKLGFTAMFLITVTGLFSQTVQEGKRLLFMHRYQSAKTTLEKVVTAAPTNAEGIYWLAQAQFELKDLNGAKEVLRKGMEGSNGSNPLLLVAMGQAELAEK